MILTVAQQLIQQGFMEGFERGFIQSFERGIIATNRKTLLTMLERKFKSVPVSVRKNILSILDDVYLQTLFIEAMECQTMDEFSEKLR